MDATLVQQLLQQAAEDRALLQTQIRQQGQILQRLLEDRIQAAPVAATAIDQQTKNLAEQICPFTYDADNNLTFESWYDRYATIFETEVANWSEAAKIRLLLQKFAQPDYQRFADATLPQKPTELQLADAVQRLKKMFGFRETKFALRHKCFGLTKEDGEDFIQYAARINKHGEKFDITSCTADDLKVLLFVSGLKSSQDSLILEKLLAKVDAQHVQLEAAADAAARCAIKKLTLQDLVNEAQRLIALKQDKSTVGESSSLQPASEIMAIQNRWKKRGSNPAPQDRSPLSKQTTSPLSFLWRRPLA